MTITILWILLVAAVLIGILIFAGIAITSFSQRQNEKTRNYLNEIVNSVRSSMVVMDQDGKLLLINEQFRKKFNIVGNNGEQVKQAIVDIIPKELLQANLSEKSANLNKLKFYSGNVVFDWRLSWYEDGEKKLRIVNGLDISELYNTQQNLIAAKEKLRTEAEKIERAKRGEIAEEIHRNIGASLSFIRHDLIELAENTQKEVSEKAENLSDRVFDLKKEIASIVFRLNPFSNKALTFSDVFKSILEDQQQKLNLNIKVDINVNGMPRNESLENFISSAVQELVINAKKHGKAKNIEVDLFEKNDKLTLTVSDDGKGFNPNQIKPIKDDGGFGLTYIKDRIKSIGGKIAIRSTNNGNGSLFIIEIPIEQEPR